jgi:hypothetical protein
LEPNVGDVRLQDVDEREPDSGNGSGNAEGECLQEDRLGVATQPEQSVREQQQPAMQTTAP